MNFFTHFQAERTKSGNHFIVALGVVGVIAALAIVGFLWLNAEFAAIRNQSDTIRAWLASDEVKEKQAEVAALKQEVQVLEQYATAVGSALGKIDQSQVIGTELLAFVTAQLPAETDLVSIGYTGRDIRMVFRSPVATDPMDTLRAFRMAERVHAAELLSITAVPMETEPDEGNEEPEGPVPMTYTFDINVALKGGEAE